MNIVKETKSETKIHWDEHRVVETPSRTYTKWDKHIVGETLVGSRMNIKLEKHKVGQKPNWRKIHWDKHRVVLIPSGTDTKRDKQLWMGQTLSLTNIELEV